MVGNQESCGFAAVSESDRSDAARAVAVMIGPAAGGADRGGEADKQGREASVAALMALVGRAVIASH
jgi:hypothetical protein